MKEKNISCQDFGLITTEKPQEQGTLIYCSCQERKEDINGMTPPDRTISGTYHFLADQRCIGWHPNWEEIIKKEDQIQNEKPR